MNEVIVDVVHTESAIISKSGQILIVQIMNDSIICKEQLKEQMRITENLMGNTDPFGVLVLADVNHATTREA